MSIQTSNQTSNQTSKPMFVTPCKYAMKCTRNECTGAHPSPSAPDTARISKAVKMCRDDLSCTRPDCYFGHQSPACVNLSEEQYMKNCDGLYNNFYDFWENEHPSVPRDDALQTYLTTFFPPEMREFVSHCIEVVETEWEERKITEEMEECEKAIDSLHPPVIVEEEEEEDDDAYINALYEQSEELEAMREGDEFFAEL